jgi:hypothetical protein
MNSVFPLVTLDVRDTVSIQEAIASNAITGRIDVVNAVLVSLVHWKKFQLLKENHFDTNFLSCRGDEISAATNAQTTI